jgi:hypothetical protein
LVVCANRKLVKLLGLQTPIEGFRRNGPAPCQRTD